MEHLPHSAVDSVEWAGSPSAAQDQDGGWMVSFVDILMLLLTLFVLLLAFHTAQQPAVEPAEPPREPVAARTAAEPVSEQAETLTVTPAVTIALALPEPAELLSEGQSMAALLAALREPAPRLAPEPVAPAAPAPQPTIAPQPTLQLSTELQRRVEVAVSADAVNLNIKDEVLFDLASAELKADAQPVLGEIVAVLRDNDYAVSVEGHTDDTPIHSARFPSNWDLSVARATHVTRYLIEHGIARERLRAVGYADTRPLEPGTTPQARARNRRVALVIHVRDEDQPEPPAHALAAPITPVANGG